MRGVLIKRAPPEDFRVCGGWVVVREGRDSGRIELGRPRERAAGSLSAATTTSSGNKQRAVFNGVTAHLPRHSSAVAEPGVNKFSSNGATVDG